MVQIILTLVVVGVLLLITFFLYRARKNERKTGNIQEHITIRSLGEMISKDLAESVRDDNMVLAGSTYYEAAQYKKKSFVAPLHVSGRSHSNTVVALWNKHRTK